MVASRDTTTAVRSSWLGRTMLRSRVVDANDGIIATAGIVEGFAAAGATGMTVVVAALAAMVAGGMSLGAATYAESAVEADAAQAVLERERRRIEGDPQAELAELAELYERKGLTPELAADVAAQLTEHDALAAHADAEYHIAVDKHARPVATGILAGLAFALGAGIPLMAVVLAPDSLRVPVTFGAAVLSLIITSILAARLGGTRVSRTIMRTVTIGVATMLITLAGGSLINL